MTPEELEAMLHTIAADYYNRGITCLQAADTIANLRRQLSELEQMRQRDLNLAERHMNEKHELRRQLDEARALAGEHWADLCLATEKNDKLIAERDIAERALAEGKRRKGMKYYRKLTKAQVRALHHKWEASPQGLTYRQFRRTIHYSIPASDPAIMVQWCGMWLGIEPDGHCHS